jgi:hypothetical protein
MDKVGNLWTGADGLIVVLIDFAQEGLARELRGKSSEV